MRIAVVAANQSTVGGVETYLDWLLAALVKRGHQVAFAFEHASSGAERAVAFGVEPLVRWNLKTMPHDTFLQQLTSFRADVVFLHALEDEALDLELTRRFRTVLFAHAFYAACATGRRVRRIPSRQVCPRRFGPACVPINYLRGCGYRNPVPLLQLYSKQRARSQVLRGIAALVVASEYMRAVYVQHGVPESDIHVIPPPAAFAPDEDPPVALKPRNRVLFLGRLTSNKGAVRAIQAAALCQRSLRRPLQLTIAGDGPDFARCKELATKLAVTTEFCGWVNSEQRIELLRSADVLIVPSMWPEPFGIVGVEAASVGVPAVAYPAGGIVDWLRAGESGELAEGTGFGKRSLAKALARVLQNEEHYRVLQLGAWRMALKFGGERHLSKLEALFHDVGQASPFAEPEMRVT